MYKVEWKDEALESLAKLDDLGDEIRDRFEKHLASNPNQNGKRLERNLEGLHRYRLGDYRVIYQILETKLIITALDVGNRWENFYEKFEKRWAKQRDLNTSERPKARDFKRKVGRKLGR